MSSPRSWIVLAVIVVFATGAVGATAGREHVAAGPSYKKVGSWGKLGTGNGQFGGNALGLATDKGGNVYVADTENHRIQVFSAKGGFKSKIAFGPASSVPDVGIDPQGNVWGTDLQGAKAQQFSKAGGPLASVTTPGQAEGIGVDANGNVYVASSTTGGSSVVVRFDKSATGFTAGKTLGGFQSAGDVEVSADGSIYVADRRGSPPSVKRFDGTGKLVKTIKLQMPATAGAGAQFGIGVDLDCNVWATNVSQRNVGKYSPAGKLLATVTSGDLIGYDVAVGPTGDLYVYDNGTHSVIHLAEDRSKPQAANVGGVTVAKKGAGLQARVKFTLSGVACPAQITGTASLSGAVKGKAVVKVPAGRSTVLTIPVKGASGQAQFKIVLKTNGRPTTQTSSVTVRVP